MINLDHIITEIAELVNREISLLLPKSDNKLSQAMRYSAESPGKRLRPFILVSTADIFEVNRAHSVRAAAAIEIVHSYSLIHDDLPAMDDDDYRRGLPSCHKKFDEATAILAGDSLLTLAFEILSDDATHPDGKVRCNLIKSLAENIGVHGMAGGQMYDLIYEREVIASYPEIFRMHWMKTARLFIASSFIGATLGYASDHNKQHLIKYAEFFGLAFQFIDDLEDFKEKKKSNNNVVQIIGKKETKIEINNLTNQAIKELEYLSLDTKILENLAKHLLARV